MTILKKNTLFLGVFVLAIALVVPTIVSADSYSGYNYYGTYNWGPWAPVYSTPAYGYPSYLGTSQPQTQYQYQYQFQNEDQYVQYLLQIIAQMQAYLRNYDYDNYYYDYGDRNYNSEIEITTRSATSIDDDAATLRGSIDFNSSDYAYVWFEYGEDDNDLDDDSTQIRLDDNDDEDFSIRIRGLDNNQRYYFRAVGEDEDGDEDYGSIRNFRTDRNGGSGNDDEPDVTTNSATSIGSDDATLRGEVDMNDFNNGVVFFVYGEDENQIDDVEDDYDTYSEVDEDGDDLQKVRVDSDLDGRQTYTRRVSNLDGNTDIYFAICVEYEDEDDDDVLKCGTTRNFETD